MAAPVMTAEFPSSFISNSSFRSYSPHINQLTFYRWNIGVTGPCCQRHYPCWPEALEIVNADTVKRWRQQGFRHYLLGKSRRGGPGRPAIEPEIRSLIQRMSRQNVFWGAPRIHGELLKLGVNVCQTTVAKYMVRRAGPPSQRWGTFLRNHTRELVPSEFRTDPIGWPRDRGKG